MEIALKTTGIDCYETAFSQTLRKEESQDAVVPDTLPDIGTILCTSGSALIRSKDVGEGRIRLEANVPAVVAYTAEDGGSIHTLEVNVPFYVSIENESIPEGGICVADLSLCALETRELNPRKVCVRAEVEFAVDCYQPGRKEFPGAPETAAEGVHLRERQAAFTAVCAVTEKTCVISDEFTIPASQPPASALLSRNTLLQLEDVKSVGTKLVVKGSAKSSLLYCSEDGAAGTVEFTTTFSQVVETETDLSEAEASVTLLLSGAYYDFTGGDGHSGNMELHLVIQAVVCANEEAEVVTDAYSNRCALNAERERRETEKILRTVTLRETLRETLATEKPVAEVVQGCYSLGRARAEGDAALLPVSLRVCCRGGDGRLFTLRRTVTVKFDCALGENQRLEPLCAAGQELYLAPAAGGVEVRLPVELRARVWEREALDCVTALETDEENAPDLTERPTLVLLRAASGDDLWTMAKENASTVEAITEANGLAELAPPWSKLLLIPKTL